MVELTQSFMIPLVWFLILQFIIRRARTVLNFRGSPLKVLEFSSALNVVAWKVFFYGFWLSKTEYES